MHQLSYVYILASGFKHLYIGVTTELEQRIRQHQTDTHPTSFTARYKTSRRSSTSSASATSPPQSPVRNSSNAGPA
jgi:predicted GIY-YIG superfamily endonuclease